MDEETMAWLKKATEGSAEKIRGSSVFLGLLTGNYLKDPLCALQLGIAILMGKPIGVMAIRGAEVSETLKKIAFHIEYVDGVDDMGEATKRMIAAFDKLKAKP